MATTGYSGTPLVKKLGFKQGHRVVFRSTPDHYFQLLAGLPKIFVLPSPGKESADLIHLFCTRREALEEAFPVLKEALKKSGMLWVSWPKASSALPTDLNGNIVRQTGLEIGLVDVKVCAVDADWSALKFMYRRKDRG